MIDPDTVFSAVAVNIRRSSSAMLTDADGLTPTL
jgi:hypothetical protein